MNIEIEPDGSYLFTDIDALIISVFRRIPDAANPEGNEMAEGRLYVDPVSMDLPEADSICEEWSEWVHPDLKFLFESALETIREDLDSVQEKKVKNEKSTLYSMRIPPSHAEAWLNGLNQARLVLAAKYGFDEEDMNRELDVPFLSEREFALWQVNFYAWLQEIFLWEPE